VITCGDLQLNYCRATAVAVRQLGFQPILLLAGRAKPAGNYLLDQLLGARIYYCTKAEYAEQHGVIMCELAEHYGSLTPYIIPKGGNLGALGYIEATRERGQRFDGVAVCDDECGSVSVGSPYSRGSSLTLSTLARPCTL
jgi:1-aminocyclopropane-1-carboxylate deaminase/D-cysteine desulfhydrase-like pyridoxal-dependent ACC family enzyme